MKHYKDYRQDITDAIARQDDLYNQAMDPFFDGEVSDYDTAYSNYIKSLNHFDAKAYQLTVDAILADTDEVIDSFADRFKNIPEYLGKRNNFDQRCKDIMTSDDAVHNKSAAIDGLDRSRTYSHNGVIDLFNAMNAYARKRGIALPYPADYDLYDRGVLSHRADVAEVLVHNTPLMENTNHLIRDKFETLGHTETTADKMRSLSTSELYKIAKKRQADQQLKESVEELSESAQTDIDL